MPSTVATRRSGSSETLPENQRFRLGRIAPGCAGAPEQRPDPAPELADRERLRDVVVRAELEPEHLVELVVARREHDDRHRALGPEPLADLEPVELRQHDVEHDEVDGLGGEEPEGLLAVPGRNDAETVAFERIR